ncbi:DoxX family protein [Lihuaxuella thermophila]|uniref:DoxX-like family protein n=1 Tax=Lihuaxuella thermophila TaxID=1173111 RepID=A0A1H8H4K3_9BACL|nr:DoxX family protein [Lihuaxuella thermophila]SEN51282.1 DoxX-like family protein [Lihuaxuella thermophila]
MNKGLNIAGKVLLVVVGLFFVMNGFFKLSGAEQAVTSFQKYGFPDWFRVLIGLAELVGGAGLIFRKTSFYAAALLAAVMVGAVGTHLLNGEFAALLMPIVLFVILAITVVKRKPAKQVDTRQ